MSSPGSLEPAGRSGARPGASGTDSSRCTAGTPTRDRLTLIADLLARAEGSDSLAERELALARAQKEAARHGIDLAEAEFANAQAGAAPEPEERTVEIGRPRTAGLRTFTSLFLIVADVNDVRCLVARDGSKVFAHGMRSDIDIAETIYASLLVQMEHSAQVWLDSGAYLRERRMDILGEGMRVADAGVARRSFRRGFVGRTGELLVHAADEARREALDKAERREETQGRPGQALTSTALALRAKSRAVEEFHQRVVTEQNVRGTWRPRSAGNTSLGGYQAGRAAAERAHARTRGRS